MSVVVDSSVLVAALVDSSAQGEWAECVVAGDALHAPELVLAETMNVLRRLERAKVITTAAANGAQVDLMRLDIELFPFAPLADRIWALRHNVTSYDAWYVAAAETLGVALATLDDRLIRSKGARCQFVTLKV